MKNILSNKTLSVTGLFLCLSTVTAMAQNVDGESQTAKLIYKPSVDVPVAAAEKGLAGACVIKFDLSSTGQPTNLQSHCSDSIFEAEAIRVVSSSVYSPKMISGTAVMQAGLIDTIQFEKTKPNASSQYAGSDSLPEQAPENAELTKISQRLDALQHDTDSMKCAESAIKENKSGNTLKGLGAIAKFAGYDDVAKGINYYEQADTLVKKLSKEENTLYEICMRKLGHGSQGQPRYHTEQSPTQLDANEPKTVSAVGIVGTVPNAAPSAGLPAGSRRVTLIRDNALISTNKVFVLVDGEKYARIKREEPTDIILPPDAKFMRIKVGWGKFKKFDVSNVVDGQTLRVKHNPLTLRFGREYEIVEME